MRKRRLGLVLCAAATTAILSCGDNNPIGPDGNGDWLPLAVGNEWVYAYEGLWVDNSTDADTSVLVGTSSLTVTGQTTHTEGFDLFLLRDISFVTITTPDTVLVSRDTTITYVQSDSGNVYSYQDTHSSYSAQDLQSPLVPGAYWHPYPGAEDITRTVTSVTVTMTVPAGTFSNCAQLTDVDTGDLFWSVSRIYVQGVGQIQTTAVYGDSDWVAEDNTSLVSYTVN